MSDDGGDKRPIDGMSVSPAVGYTARKHVALAAADWKAAQAAAYDALRHCSERPEDVFMLRENARDYVELTLGESFRLTDTCALTRALALEPEMPPAQLCPLVFSLVAPNDWPGTRGVAAHVLGEYASPVCARSRER